MFRKLLSAKIRRRAIILFLGLVLYLITSLSLSPQKSLSQKISLASAKPTEIISKLSLSDKVMIMEQKLEAEFETYFNRNLAETTKTGDEIAQILLEIRKNSKTNPAVIWIIPELDYLHLVLITPGKQPIIKDINSLQRETLIQAVKSFHYDITNPRNLSNNSYLTQAQKIYQWVIAPLEETLQAERINTILFCLGNGLRTLPIAALHDGNQFLVEKYSFSIIPAFNLINSNYTPITKANVLAMGASEFVSNSPLPAVPLELSTIVNKNIRDNLSNQIPADKISGELFLNQEFTLENLKNKLLSQSFNIIHLATHAEFKPGNPQNSYIQFWNTQLRLNDMKQISWNNPTTELLVLSACRTAVGDAGAELGFAGLALQTGVESALASLWYVNDIGTLALMSEFYQQLKTAETKAEAIRQTQINMIKGDVHLTGETLKLSRDEIALPQNLSNLKATNFSHPFYWSSFTLISSPW
ncbi:MAG: CHAT domain-containing protein [Microcoleaceae cyanobacterium]